MLEWPAIAAIGRGCGRRTSRHLLVPEASFPSSLNLLNCRLWPGETLATRRLFGQSPNFLSISIYRAVSLLCMKAIQLTDRPQYEPIILPIIQFQNRTKSYNPIGSTAQHLYSSLAEL